MGLMRFLVPDRNRLPQEAIDRAYITGIDEVPWPSRIVGTDDGLIVDRPMGESSCLYLPWPVDEVGEITLSTASLMERTAPYLLEIELARGTLNRIRNQIAGWEGSGLSIPGEIRERLGEVIREFSLAVTNQHEPAQACQSAQAVLRKALALTSPLGACYSDHVLAARQEGGSKLTTLFGANLGPALLNDIDSRNFLSTFNAAAVPVAWRDVEVQEGKRDWTRTDQQISWCEHAGLKVASGPILQFDGAGVPDWVYLWEDDEENLLNFMCDFARAVVTRYQGRMHIWQCAARMNAGEFLGLSDEQKMRIAVRAVEIVRQLDVRTPLVVTFDQPWGEFISHHEMDLPIHFADAMIRSNLGLAGIGLEINVGYYPRGSQIRDVLEFSRQLDRWALLGLPLLVTLTVPSASGADKHARLKSQPLPDDWSPQRQEAWVRDYLPVILAKQAVQAVIWNQLRDDEPHDFCHGGLIDAEARPKPALAQLAALRKKHLA